MAKQKVTLSLEPAAYTQLQARSEDLGLSVSAFVSMMAWFGQMTETKQEYREDSVKSALDLLLYSMNTRINSMDMYRNRMLSLLKILQAEHLPELDLERDCLQAVIEAIEAQVE